MIKKIRQLVKSIIAICIREKIFVTWEKRGENSCLAEVFKREVIRAPTHPYSLKIEKLAIKTNKKGAQPLWDGYANHNTLSSTRTPDSVRTSAIMGNIYTHLVKQMNPAIIVEFGTAFGVSGMYFLAGISANEKGYLLTFEPNTVWAKLAKENLSQISNQFKLTNGTFEENIGNVLPKGSYIDIAFIDAIHTKEFVIPQLEIVISNSKKGTVIILDDINFSDDMRQCWEEVSTDSRFISSLKLGNRVGVLEVK